ncbi:MAG: M28 family peptidase [Gaiellaceae bacterium]
MSASPATRRRRRARRGSLDRPISGRTYRGTWLFVAFPLLLAAFTVTRPAALPRPALPAAFDRVGATQLAFDLASAAPDRSPATAGATLAAQWFVDQLRPYGFVVRRDRFEADVAGRGRLPFENLVAVVPGRSPSAIMVVAHRDNTGAGSGANDNASGTAALIELARSYASPAGASTAPSTSRRVTPAHTLVFLSTDGGALGGVGAAHFVEHSPLAQDVSSVVDLDAIAGHGPTRLQFAGDKSQFPSSSLLATAAARVLEQGGEPTTRPSALRQLLDLAFPFSAYEQAPFLGRSISAVTLTSAGDRPPTEVGDTPGFLQTPMSRARLGQIGRSAQQLLASLDAGLEFTQGTTTYVWFGARVVRGWAVEIALVAALLPFLVAAVDLFAFLSRRRVGLLPAIRSLRSRVLFWLFVALLFELFGLVGWWPHSSLRAPALTESAGTDWPVVGLLVLAGISTAGWLVARDRLLPRREVDREEELAGHCAALLALALVALLVVALNAFALVFLLPSLHAWLWLAQLGDRPLAARLAIWTAGLAGPLLLVWEFAGRFGLGLDSPWYLLQLAALNHVSLVALAVFAVWAGSAAQLAALAGGRYAPYPSAAERPPLGPIRRSIRRAVLSSRARRRVVSAEQEVADA